ncbi:MAG: hypothetical protein PWQ45_1489 [Thermosipho sp. (in: thermotogales)]|nr:hypothetical protein [Thermosipho sp. (in: thermotogales)]
MYKKKKHMEKLRDKLENEILNTERNEKLLIKVWDIEDILVNKFLL